jgi:hypothetical protein
MSKTEKLVGKKLSFEKVRKDLNNTSPLQMSKKLIEYELYDQRSSIEIMDKIYEEFESKNNIIDNLVNPMLLSVADGIIKHPKLNGTFRKINMTPSRLVKEVNSFTYNIDSKKEIDEDVFLTQAEKSYYNNEKTGRTPEGKEYNKQYHRKKYYDTKERRQTEEDKNIVRDETIVYTNEKGETKTKTTTVIKDDVTGEDLDLTKEGAEQKNINSADMDHVNPINSIRNKYKNNPYLYRDDMQKIIGLKDNESYINSSLNQSKGDMTWSEYIKKHPDALTKKEQAKALKLEAKANKEQNDMAAKLMAKNIGLKGLGDIIILLLKPIWFELKDMFKNGILNGMQTQDKIEAFILRLKRVKNYIQNNVLNTLGDSLKDILSNFVGILINSIVGVFTGMFKKIIQIISDGFMAIKEAFEIMLKPTKEMSSAQKADAITKIIASAIVPILIFSFEETLSKIPIIGDIAVIIVSGVATTLVVWLLDEIDLFSVKDEKRMQRIKEIFQLRIENIKNNTDIFEKNALEVLAKQKLQFIKIIDNLNTSIDNNMDANRSVYQVADFMKIDLKIKTTNDFITMLIQNKELKI